jgi:hypothetical protein
MAIVQASMGASISVGGLSYPQLKTQMDWPDISVLVVVAPSIYISASMNPAIQSSYLVNQVGFALRLLIALSKHPWKNTAITDLFAPNVWFCRKTRSSLCCVHSRLCMALRFRRMAVTWSQERQTYQEPDRIRIFRNRWRLSPVRAEGSSTHISKTRSFLTSNHWFWTDFDDFYGWPNSVTTRTQDSVIYRQVQSHSPPLCISEPQCYTQPKLFNKTRDRYQLAEYSVWIQFPIAPRSFLMKFEWRNSGEWQGREETE